MMNIHERKGQIKKQNLVTVRGGERRAFAFILMVIGEGAGSIAGKEDESDELNYEEIPMRC